MQEQESLLLHVVDKSVILPLQAEAPILVKHLAQGISSICDTERKNWIISIRSLWASDRVTMPSMQVSDQWKSIHACRYPYDIFAVNKQH